MKIKYSLAQFMAAADYLAKYHDHLDRSPLEWLVNMEITVKRAAEEGSTLTSSGGYGISLSRECLGTPDLVAEIWVNPQFWSGDGGPLPREIDLNPTHNNGSENGSRATEAVSLQAA